MDFRVGGRSLVARSRQLREEKEGRLGTADQLLGRCPDFGAGNQEQCSGE
jgi:hypothetical protein